MAAFEKYVLNNIITLPQSLIYTDQFGNPVYSLYPLDYLILVGGNVNTIKNNYVALSAKVSIQSSQIATLHTLCSGITTPYVTPQVDGKCLNANTFENIDTLLEKQIVAWCNFIALTGSNSDLTTAIAYQCTGLNSAPSFTTPGTSMSAISGWVLNPTKVSDSLRNLWLTVCDLRGGMSTLFAAVTPTCSQVIINFAAYLPSYTTGIDIYFDGYTFIPSGFTDTGSVLTITDSAGNLYTQSINLVTLSASSTPLNIPLTGTALLPTSTYSINIGSSVHNSTLGLTCQKKIIQTLQNTISACPVMNLVAATTSISYTMLPVITSSITYTVDLLNASGTTLQTQTYSSPSTIQLGTFSGLVALTNYGVRVTSTILGMAPITCPTQLLKTTT